MTPGTSAVLLLAAMAAWEIQQAPSTSIRSSGRQVDEVRREKDQLIGQYFRILERARNPVQDG